MILTITLAVFFFSLLAEWLHGRRVARVADLAFGRTSAWRKWRFLAAGARILGATLMAWGLSVLYQLPAGSAPAKDEKTPEGGFRHIILVVDVSPSMRLEDAGPSGKQKRVQRGKDVVESVLQRVNLDQTRVSVIAMYSDAKTVVKDTVDLGVVRNIMDDLPLRWAFEVGKTNLFAGLKQAVELARPWQPESTTLIFLTDGDSIPDKGAPALPRSVRQTLVLGVGNPVQGKFIDGHQSRQDSPTLRQFASRLGGTFLDVNKLNVPTRELSQLSESLPLKSGAGVGLREAALVSIALGGALLGLLPLVLGLYRRDDG
jgi:Ca-activated chloride channel homolog